MCIWFEFVGCYMHITTLSLSVSLSHNTHTHRKLQQKQQIHRSGRIWMLFYHHHPLHPPPPRLERDPPDHLPEREMKIKNFRILGTSSRTKSRGNFTTTTRRRRRRRGNDRHKQDRHRKMRRSLSWNGSCNWKKIKFSRSFRRAKRLWCKAFRSNQGNFTRSNDFHLN